MQHVMRKYRKYILFFIILFVGIPMLFFGVPTAFDAAGRGGDRVIATIGNVPLQESEFRRNYMGQDTFDLSPAQRMERADDVLNSMIDSALIEHEEQSRRFRVDESILISQMQEWDQFKNADGEFDPRLWNQWVNALKARGMNWKEIYQEMAEGVARQVYMNTVLARAERVFEDEITKKVEDEFTKYRIRYAQIDVNPQLSEEELLAHYEEFKDTYKLPSDYVVEFVAIPLTPPMPENVPDIVAEARGGADFAALADQHSNQGVQNGGDIGWQRQGAITLEHREPLFALQPGEVSDPVAGPNGYFIYKVEEERFDEETGAREVKARQIFLPVDLSTEERTQRETQAEDIKAAAAEEGFEAAAEAAGLSISNTGQFNSSSSQIEGLPRTDVTQFSSAFAAPSEDEYRVITGRSNIYVARISETIEGVVPSYEEVADRVRTDATSVAKRGDAHRAKIDGIAARIAEEANSLDEMQNVEPGIDLNIQESNEFSGQDFFVQGVFIQSAPLIDAIRDKEPGQLVGPLKNAFQDTYFVELLAKTEPTEEDRAQFAEARERIRDNETLMARFRMLDDYRKDLRERLIDSGKVSMTVNDRVLQEILAGLVPAEDEDGEEAPGLLQ